MEPDRNDQHSESRRWRALLGIAVLTGLVGLISTTGLVLSKQYLRLIVPLALLSGLAFVVVGYVIAGRFENAVSNRQLF